jgi:hypothetical protein
MRLLAVALAASTMMAAACGGSRSAAPVDEETTAAAQTHYESALEYQEAGELGLALAEVEQALALNRRFSEAERLRTTLRAEATKVVQQAHAAATEVAQEARAAATHVAQEASIAAAARASQPIVLNGSGQTATNPFQPPAEKSRIAFSHNGRRNFIVRAYVGNDRDGLVNKIGVYEGVRLLEAKGPVTLDIQADGGWRAVVSSIPPGAGPAFSGRGDDVSGLFSPPGNGPWEFGHDGQRNFIVKLHCASGRSLIQNRIGAATGSQVITFGRGPCFWEVEADGSWSLAPR